MKNSISTIMTIAAFPFNAIAAPVDLLLCVPGIGRVIKWIWNIIVTLIHAPFGLFEWFLLNKGFHPEKKLKLSVVIFTNENGIPVVDAQKAVDQLKQTVTFYKEKANVRVLSANSRASEEPSTDWITIYQSTPLARANRVGCNLAAFREDLWLTGMMFQFMAVTRLFHTNFQRIIGYGSPIVVYIVEEVEGVLGCSLGPLTDYVTVAANGLVCMAHEIGHACNLMHEKETDNFMHHHGCNKPTITTKQIAFMRASRHVTFI